MYFLCWTNKHILQKKTKPWSDPNTSVTINAICSKLRIIIGSCSLPKELYMLGGGNSVTGLGCLCELSQQQILLQKYPNYLVSFWAFRKITLFK